MALNLPGSRDRRPESEAAACLRLSLSPRSTLPPRPSYSPRAPGSMVIFVQKYGKMRLHLAYCNVTIFRHSLRFNDVLVIFFIPLGRVIDSLHTFCYVPLSNYRLSLPHLYGIGWLGHHLAGGNPVHDIGVETPDARQVYRISV